MSNPTPIEIEQLIALRQPARPHPHRTRYDRARNEAAMADTPSKTKTRPRQDPGEVRVVVWFSCGAASAVAARLAIEKYGTDRVSVVYCDTMADEHPDNQRFFDDVQQWLGVPIERIQSDRYTLIEEVFEARKYMSGIAGAPCTVELKKRPRFAYQEADDIHVFGYTREEQRRIGRFEQSNPELHLDWILRDADYSKGRCLTTLDGAGIVLPVMYGLDGAFKNNNCIGCVKATSSKYWTATRRHFPEIWQRRAEMSRRLWVRMTRIRGERVFIDELPPDEDDGVIEDISCGPECADEQRML